MRKGQQDKADNISYIHYLIALRYKQLGLSSPKHLEDGTKKGSLTVPAEGSWVFIHKHLLTAEGAHRVTVS